MKKIKKIMAFALAMVMVLAMALPAMAADTAPTAPTSGSITINSPIVGATYKVYKIFDMTTNADKTAFSYTIKESEEGFYPAVKAYAEATDSEATGEDANKPINGLTLTKIAGTDPAVYNVSIDKNVFDAQKFGQAMRDYADKKNIAPDYSKKCMVNDEANNNENTSDYIKFDGVDANGDNKNDGIPLGYYLINATYPPATGVTVKLDDDHTFTVTDLKTNAEGKYVDEDGNVVELENAILSENALTKINDYVADTVDDDFVNAYITEHRITANKNGTPLNDAGKAEYKDDLIASMTEDAIQKVLEKLTSTESAHDSDINVKEPTLVFLDSSQPDAVINEKNELDKWDVPVNPDGNAKPGTPDHGEPEGGKNIVAGEDENGNAIYADWSDAEIGESVHYQLRINAINFIQDTTSEGKTPQQVKEYILADYESAHMHYDETKGIRVSVWQGDNDNKSQDGTTQTNVTSNAVLLNNGKSGDEAKAVTYNGTDKYLDYSDYADVFFKNDSNPAKDGVITQFDQNNNSVFGNGTGIVVPWVIVSKEDKSSTYPVYSTTNVPKKDENNNFIYKKETIKKDENNNLVPYREVSTDSEGKSTWVPVTGLYVSENNHVVSLISGSTTEGYVVDTNPDGSLKQENNTYVFVKDTEPVYTYSIYNSDVTIVVDYWMILDDKAIVDEPGNKNFAQYGWNPIDNKNTDGTPKTPTDVTDEDKPSQKEKVDEATVYTYALAWVKTNEQGKALKDAEFKLPFYVKAETKTIDGKEVVVPIKDNDGAYIFAFSLKDEATGKIKTDENGNPVEVTADTYPEDKSKTPDAEGKYPKFTAANTTNLIVTDETGVITIKGVEQGTYSITETKAPAGYNKLIAPFTVEAKKSGTSVTTTTKTTIYLDANGNVTDTVTDNTVVYNTDKDSNVDNVPVYQFKNIENKQGTELPSTGGIGTTIFYVLGAILVLGAGILLVTRRRMAA